MIKYEFWNKQTPINGVEAGDILKDSFFSNARSIFLIVDENRVVTRIESVDVVKSNNGWNDKTDEEVATCYLDSIINPPITPIENLPATKKELQILGQQMSDLELLILSK